MADDLRKQVATLEKENRRIRHKLRQAHEAYKKMEAERNQIEEDSFKEKALPAHYQDIEEKLEYYQNMTASLTSENEYLENKLKATPIKFPNAHSANKGDNVTELQETIKLQSSQIDTLIAEKNQISRELKSSKAEIAEVLIDAKTRARKIVETADDEAVIFKNQALVDLAVFKKELQEKQQTILKSKLDISQLFEEIDIKMTSLTKLDLDLD